MQPQFFTYILTNWNRSLLYVGMTNNLAMWLIDYYIGIPGSHTTTYNIHYLVWYEQTKYVLNAIDYEKKIKKYLRAERDALINTVNPEWRFLNAEVLGNWPPTEVQILQAKARWKSPDQPDCF